MLALFNVVFSFDNLFMSRWLNFDFPFVRKALVCRLIPVRYKFAAQTIFFVHMLQVVAEFFQDLDLYLCHLKVNFII